MEKNYVIPNTTKNYVLLFSVTNREKHIETEKAIVIGWRIEEFTTSNRAGSSRIGYLTYPLVVKADIEAEIYCVVQEGPYEKMQYVFADTTTFTELSEATEYAAELLAAEEGVI